MQLTITPSLSYVEHLMIPPQRTAPLFIRNILPEYRITGILGAGGSADVFSGTDKDDNPVAIKIPQMKFDETIEDAVIERFEKEAGIWKNLKHRNIVKFYSAADQPIPHIVMELMDGGSLRRLMKGHRLSEGETVQIMFQVLEGLSHAHRMATVHRDIKPENVLFRSNGVAKITDWGIGKFMASASMSMTVGTKGTINYSAPEQFDNKKFGEIDWQTDIFQTGVMFYEMLTGENPFYGEDLPEVFVKVTNVVPDPPSSLNPDLPESLDEVVVGAIGKYKKDRWRSADVMLVQLKNAVGGKAVVLPSGEDKVQKSAEREASADAKVKVNAGQCSKCGNFITPENRRLRCKNCKRYVCQECEGWINKEKEYSGYIIEVKYPLCEKCYHKELVVEKAKLRDYVEKQKRKREKGEKEKQREIEWNRWFGPVTRYNSVKRRNEWAKRLGCPITIQNDLGMRFVFIPPGTFLMGSELWKDTQPIHKVLIKGPFYIGVAPITQLQWREVLGYNPSYFKRGIFRKRGLLKTKDEPNHPVETVSWWECQAFIKKLNKMYPRDNYSLPTEAQWEYAARAGREKLFCFGDIKDGLFDHVWCNSNSNNETHDVAVKKSNVWGLYDIHGNVWEWCRDNYESGYYANSPEADPEGPENGSIKVIRGGSWDIIPTRCGSAHRNCRPADFKKSTIGFRLVCYRGLTLKTSQIEWDQPLR